MIRVGQKLRDERVRKGLVLGEVARATKIKEHFLVAIEKGEYNKLPSSAYAQGFIKNYAEYLGLPLRQTLAMFRREFDEEKYFKVLPQGFTNTDFSRARPQLRSGLIGGGLVLLALIVYLLFQYRYAIINPPLTITQPLEQQVIGSESVTVAGTTDPNASIFINGKPIIVEENGEFTETISVFPGVQTISIVSVNKFKRETKEERRIIVKEKE